MQKTIQLFMLIFLMKSVSIFAVTAEDIETSTGIKPYAGAEFSQELTDYANELQEKMLSENPEIAQYAPKISSFFLVSDDSYENVLEFYKTSFNVDKISDMSEALAQATQGGDEYRAFEAELPLSQQAEMYKLMYRDDKIDPTSFEGNQKSAVFSKGIVPTVSISNRFIHPKSYQVMDKTLILIMKVEEPVA